MVSTVQGGGNVVLQAGNDVVLQAANVQAGNALAVQAGGDLLSTTVTDASALEQGQSGKRWSQSVSAHDETVHGTTLQAGGDIALVAGRDVSLTAAGVYSEEGGIAVSAGRDVNLLSAQEQHDLTLDEQRTKKGFLKRKTTTTHDEWHDSLAVGSTLSGETVQVAAGRDLTAQGAQIAGTGDVLLAAGRDLTLTTAENTYSEVHDKTVKKSGVFSGGGIGFTIGKQQTDTEADVTGVTHSGSTVGSLEGDVTLVAGNALSIDGSDVVALEGDITAKAKSIAITEVHDTSTAEQQTRFKQGGLRVAVSAPVLSLLQTADDLNKASKQSGGDGRMQALAAGAAALNAYNSAGALSELGQGLASGNAGDMAKSANVSISATIGGSKSESQSTQSSSMTKGSTLQAGGDVTLIATGGGQDSNIVVRGSDISAGNDLLLLADNAITLESAQDTAEQHSSSKSSSAAIGVAATIGSSGTSFGITASASAARGNADGEDVSQRNTHVSAGNTATVISGGDTTIKGAQLSAERVVADIGGDLNIESLQDTSTYDSKSKSAGGSVTVGAGFSGSASYSSSKVSGDYASVGEQSGIFAGDGGFDIRVEGNTDLKGAVIASTQEAVDAGMNRLQTGTLTYSDVENHSDYSAKSVSLSGGYSAGGSKDGDVGSPNTTNNGSDWSWQNFNTGAQGAAAGYGSKSGSDSSTTHSGISGGSLVITDQAGQQERTGQTAEEVLAGLNRDVLSGDEANGLAKGWDGQKLQQQVEAQAQITAMFGQQASKAVGDFAQQKMEEAGVLRRQADQATDPDERARLTAQAEQLESQWGAGGNLRLLAHTVIGGLTGGLEGATGAAVGTLTAPRVAEALQEAGVTGPLADMLTGLASTTVGTVTGGTAGAAAGLNEVANNYLTHQQLGELVERLAACEDDEACKKNAIEQAEELSRVNDAALWASCTGNTASADKCRTHVEASQIYSSNDGGWVEGLGLSEDRIDSKNYLAQFYETDEGKAYRGSFWGWTARGTADAISQLATGILGSVMYVGEMAFAPQYQRDPVTGDFNYDPLLKPLSIFGDDPSSGPVGGKGYEFGNALGVGWLNTVGSRGGVAAADAKVLRFADEAKLIGHFEKHGAEFGAASAQEYMAIGRYIAQNGTKIEYLYKGEVRVGYVVFMENSSRKGVAKFGFVGTNAKGEVTTIHVESGNSFWKMVNGDKADRSLRSVP